MKLLYLSVHAILEYDEVKLFHEMGIDVFSLGSYLIPSSPVDPIRPPIDFKVDEWLVSHAPPREALTQEFVDKFDAIMVMHGDTPEGNWIEMNWPVIKNKRVIWRTIGQSTPRLEQKMFQYRTEKLQIVRYSKRELNIEHCAGSDMVIHFYKDEKEYSNWVGAGNQVITIAQDMKTRGEHCNYNAFLELTKGFNTKIYGPRNDNSGDLNGGFLTYDEMKQKYRDARVYIYTGTQPASYTLNFIEAMMTGVPIVALGPKFGNSLDIAGELYEIPDLITNGANGYWSDNLDELRGRIEYLLKDKKHAERIGFMGRQRAIELFGKESIKRRWKEFLGL